MRIADILHHKGSGVVTVSPTETLEQAARLLADRLIGALVVCDQYGRVQGVLSERDIVRALATHGAWALSMRVAQAILADTPTCRPSDQVKDVMERITVRRVRHLPVMEGERLIGIVSIGDVLKSRLREKTDEVELFRDLSMAHRIEPYAAP
jgi:CBS domain-containing protein